MILVVGGAGYIGSQVVNRLAEKKQVVVYDNLSTGYREAVNEKVIFIEGDLADEKRLTQVFSLFPIEAVLHMATPCSVVESIENPQPYYENVVIPTLVLLKVMRAHHVKNIIFSSKAEIDVQFNESIHEQSFIEQPILYSQSINVVEQILRDYTEAYKMNCTVLRTFNVGAKQNVFDHLHGEDDAFSDGTYFRNYVHVEDLVNAYDAALEATFVEKPVYKTYTIRNEQSA